METSGSLPPSHARSASAGTTRPIRASGTTLSGSSCASTAAGAGATPRTAKRAERDRSAAWLATVNARRIGGRGGRSRSVRRGSSTTRRRRADRARGARRRAGRGAAGAGQAGSRGRCQRRGRARLEDDELEAEPDAGGVELAADGGGRGGQGRFGGPSDDDFDGEDPSTGGGGELAVPAGSAAERAPHSGNRLVNFLQGSWRELQRVQWPDRRQVMQATGVVIGFVIVAGLVPRPGRLCLAADREFHPEVAHSGARL